MSVFGQDQKKADSARVEYETKDLQGVERLEILRILAYNETNDLELAMRYSDELIELAQSEGNHLYTYYGYASKGYSYSLMGDYDRALTVLFKSTKAALKAGSLESEAGSYTAIADVYSEMGNSNNAELYYNKGINILRKLDMPIYLASTLLNAGDEYFNSKKYSLALKNFEESGRIFDDENYPIGSAFTLGNIGMVHAEQGNHDLAENKISQAIPILEEFGVHDAISEYLTYMSDIYMNQGDLQTALDYAERSLVLAKKYGIKKQIADSNHKLSELHKEAGNIIEAFTYYQEHITYRDSLINLENVEKAANQRTAFEVAQKQVEVDLLNEQKRNQRIIVYATAMATILIGLLAFGLYRRNRFVQKTNTIIANEKARSDSLLLNILPEETAQELKEHGKVKAQKFESVTVLFADFEGFTQYAENLSPEALVESVDYYFSNFDRIMEKHQLEKIKTIGDAYMCAGGLHHPKENHAQRMLKAAFDIIEFVKSAKLEKSGDNTRFDVRVGINSGPVVAGVVGTKKFAYDIWGDTVNVASRMETNSEAGRINISEDTFKLVKNDFDCQYRGVIDVKNRGQMKMYFVKGKKRSDDHEKQSVNVASNA